MGRFRFVSKRLAHTIPLLIGISFLVFMVLKVAPGDSVRLLLGPRATEEQVSAYSREHGFDRNIFVQYAFYLRDLAHGNFGASNRSATPVTEILAERAPETIWVITSGLLFTAVLALPLGLLAAAHRDRPTDHLIRSTTLVLLYLPTFWVGFVLIRVVALPTGWFPVSGFGDTFGEHVRAVILPGMTLALAFTAVLARSIRSSVIDVLEADYVAVARTLGVRGMRLIRRHVLRNSLIPTVNILATQIGFLLFGVVLVEFTFDIQGLGTAFVDAASRQDLGVVQGITLVFALAVVMINLVADIVIASLDPRVLME
ncbi:MAG TPA: ABC transporter permease [Ilumatobacteraceae bacterium]|nr:ABC transporter permease [Ilumatobacteraceae bacterium]